MVMRDISDTDDIKILVDTFYQRASRDERLGPIFSNEKYFDSHRKALYEYWQETLFGKHLIHFPAHIESMYSPQHFVRWLTIFLETIDQYYAGPNAEKAKIAVIRKAQEFQASLEMFRF